MSNLTGQGGSPSGSGNNCTTTTQKFRRVERSNNINLPAGALYIEVHNVDMNPVGITCNGDTLSYGGKWHPQKEKNCVDGTEELCPAVSIVSTGLNYWLSVAYPASSTFDLSTL